MLRRAATGIRRLSTSLPQVRTAGCIIIGDEVLNSKITDTNSRFFAHFCYDHGIDLRKISVVGDNSLDIAEAITEFTAKFDFVVSSGGIGPTHDDITYESIASAMNLPLEVNDEALDRFKQVRTDNFYESLNETQRAAHLRMFQLPSDPLRVKRHYIDGKWVPIVDIDDKLFILPGIPKLFQELLTQGILPQLTPRISGNLENVTYFVKTSIPESKLAPTLSNLQIQAAEYNVKLGSYPHMGKGVNTISISGKKEHQEFLHSLVDAVVESLQGTEISRSEEEGLSI